jgi:anti-anti-sigma regulatory factor
MAMQHLSPHVVLITLPSVPQSDNELATAAQEFRAGTQRHVIVDFSGVEAMPLGITSSLVILQRLLSAADRQLVLCCVPAPIADAFARVGLHRLFRFAHDEFAALQSLDRDAYPYP